MDNIYEILLMIVGMTIFLCIIAYYCGYIFGYAKCLKKYDEKQSEIDKASYEISEKENSDVTDETNAPTEYYGKYVDECLNDASKHFFSEGEDKYSVADLFYAGVRCGMSWLGKQGKIKKDNTGFIITHIFSY